MWLEAPYNLLPIIRVGSTHNAGNDRPTRVGIADQINLIFPTLEGQRGDQLDVDHTLDALTLPEDVQPWTGINCWLQRDRLQDSTAPTCLESFFDHLSRCCGRTGA